MTVFDINIMIDYQRGKERASEIMPGGNSGISITVITGYELLKGRRTRKEESTINELLSKVKKYHTDSRSMRVPGSLYRELKNNGKLKNEAAMLIAGIVLANNETLITLDNDFSDLAAAMGESPVLLKESRAHSPVLRLG
ncbi:MAG: type II toxin-antitoxin system VapC family toxin [Candidatus Thermoplasmatota archaeon]|jgi:predicted nucleic acid-binding protein|nr:type II toxin-antitoxin system VapC family toxin [Candidatus Sysuiplasma jiujiangense]MCL4317214.1 type II toxin-antitoxin system VapC family toxin [Candidatus Thermoplasmatota archaeon]MCL5253829.1 type II toxin-antitoxin system VapC family toxin [Candidatus Thermoplasmatota archaeon]